MIISHKYKFIFIKTKKTAGTSIEISLSRYCGDKDILTPIAPKDESLRTQLGKSPQNYSDNEIFVKILKVINNKIIYKVRGQQLEWIQRLMLNQYNYYKHMQAQKIKKEVGDEIWSNYFKFCFERNPWDRIVSYYYYRKGTKKYGYDYTLDDFFDELTKDKKMKSEISEFSRYQINNSVAVDFIGRYEKLEEDLTLICNKLGIPFDGWLPNAKGEFRTDRRSYKELLNCEHKKLVQNLCPEVIHLMGYSFEHPDQVKPYQKQYSEANPPHS